MDDLNKAAVPAERGTVSALPEEIELAMKYFGFQAGSLAMDHMDDENGRISQDDLRWTQEQYGIAKEALQIAIARALQAARDEERRVVIYLALKMIDRRQEMHSLNMEMGNVHDKIFVELEQLTGDLHTLLR